MDLLTLAMSKALSGAKNITADDEKSTSDKTYFNITLDDVKNGKQLLVEIEGESLTDSDIIYHSQKTVITKDANGNPETVEVYVSDEEHNQVYYVDGNSLYQFRTITYKSEDGNTTLYTEQVCIGGNGTKINTETKASSVQYDYTADGWSLTPNSAKNENALLNVKTDRTVYASFASTLRSYDISFMNTININEESGNILSDENDDIALQENYSLLQKKSFKYGETPTYTGETPTQEETDTYRYEFNGWTPTITSVTGEAYYYATYTQIEK